MTDFTPYRRKQIAELRPYMVGEVLSDRVSISAADREAGSPKPGDMIARNPANHDDQWLVAADYFAVNFEPITRALQSEEALTAEIERLRGLISETATVMELEGRHPARAKALRAALAGEVG